MFRSQDAGAGRKKSRKKEPWLGKQFFVPRAEGKPVEVILYKQR